MKSFGSTSGKELNEVNTYVSKLVQENHLPEKVVLYMIRTNWVRQPQDLKQQPGVVNIVSVDGIGSKAMKMETWDAIMKVKPKHVHPRLQALLHRGHRRRVEAHDAADRGHGPQADAGVRAHE